MQEGPVSLFAQMDLPFNYIRPYGPSETILGKEIDRLQYTYIIYKFT